jgi:IS5 family transposase
MRVKIAEQQLLRPAPLPHKLAQELDYIDKLIDRHPEMVELVFNDLVAGGGDPSRGREGMSGEQVLRVKILSPRLDLSFEDMSFELASNMTYRTFCRMAPHQMWTQATLHRNCKLVRPETMERINALVVLAGVEEGLEDLSKVRGDGTRVQTHIHEPRDSSLLWDVSRVLARLMKRGQLLSSALEVIDHTKAAKRLDWRISNAKRNKELRKAHYLELLEITEETIAGARRAADALKRPDQPTDRRAAKKLVESLRHYASLGERVLDQTRRRVVDGKKVPAKEKVLSIFEPHTDLLAQGLDVTYGHKVSLVAGTTFVLDLVVEEGNPNDSTLTEPLMERHREHNGALPKQAAFDGGFAARPAFDKLKKQGIKDLVFTKGRGIPRREMASSTRVYEALRNFRAGIEGIIGYLKGNFGFARCFRKGLDGFRAFAWGCVLSANFFTFARAIEQRDRLRPKAAST